MKSSNVCSKRNINKMAYMKSLKMVSLLYQSVSIATVNISI